MIGVITQGMSSAGVIYDAHSCSKEDAALPGGTHAVRGSLCDPLNKQRVKQLGGE